MKPDSVLTPSDLAIVKFCAEEVERQGRGPIQVWNMVEAWDWAMANPQEMSTNILESIQFLGYLVEPTKNQRKAWRPIQVYVGRHVPPKPADLQREMTAWADRIGKADPDILYRDFQQIHPFVDGNGRVGKILFNYLNGTLDKPEMPSNWFGCTNY